MNLRKLFSSYLRNRIKSMHKVHDEPVQKISPHIYQCSGCTRKFTDLGYFYRHHQTCCNTSSKISCQICGKSVKTKSFQQHLKLHSESRDYLCQLCGAIFSQLSGLLLHMKQAHQPIAVHKCRFCDQICRNQPQLWNHEWTHKNPQGIECNVCNKIFKAPNLLQNHKNNVHRKHMKTDAVTREIFSCPDCDHLFNTKQQLMRHKVRHTKEKPFQCELCDQFFGWKRSLNAHIKSFHGPSILDQYPMVDIDYLCEENLMFYS